MKTFAPFTLKAALLLALSVSLWPSQAQAQCTFTNGWCRKKAASYTAYFGNRELTVQDVANLSDAERRLMEIVLRVRLAALN